MVKLETSDFEKLALIEKTNQNTDEYRKGEGYAASSTETELEQGYRSVEEKMEAIRKSVEKKLGLKLKKSQIRTARSSDPKRIQPWIWYSSFYSGDATPAGTAASLQFSIGPNGLHAASIWFEYAFDDRKRFLPAFEKLVLNLDRKLVGYVELKGQNSADVQQIFSKSLGNPETIAEFGKLMLDRKNKGGVMFTLSPSEAEAAGENIEHVIVEDMDWIRKKLYLPIFGGSEAERTESDAMPKQQQQIAGLNIILYGPPGTGKTYHTKDLAVQSILAEKSKAGQVNFSLSDILEDIKQRKDEFLGEIRNNLGNHEGRFIEIDTKDEQFIYGVWDFQRISNELFIYIQVWPNAKSDDDERLKTMKTFEKPVSELLGLDFLGYGSLNKKNNGPGKTNCIALFRTGKNSTQIDSREKSRIIDALVKLDKFMNEQR